MIGAASLWRSYDIAGAGVDIHYLVHN